MVIAADQVVQQAVAINVWTVVANFGFVIMHTKTEVRTAMLRVLSEILNVNTSQRNPIFRIVIDIIAIGRAKFFGFFVARHLSKLFANVAINIQTLFLGVETIIWFF